MNKILHLMEGIRVKNNYKSQNRNPVIWVFGEWFGERCYDNSLALANYVVKNFPDIKVYWASKSGQHYPNLDSRADIIKFGTKEALSVYRVAGVVFMNQGLGDFSEEGYDYFDGAIKVNLWHGVMWKRIGHDGSKYNNVFYRFYTQLTDFAFNADYYLATSEEYAKVCISAFGASKNNIIRAGYPRNAMFYSTQELLKAKKKTIDLLCHKTKKKWSYNTRIITYMPTFRDKVAEVFSCEALADNHDFMKWLDENNIVILQKAHFITQKRKNNTNISTESDRIIELDDINPQVLLAASDLLITDYSSCFFDYLILDRPIVHFLYDYDFYKGKDRGLYYKKEDVVCGDIAMNLEKLSQLIIQNMINPLKTHDLRIRRMKKFMTYENEKSCENICNGIFKILNFSDNRIDRGSALMRDL